MQLEKEIDTSRIEKHPSSTNRLFFTASDRALDTILKDGILTPEEVLKRIQAGESDESVLGVGMSVTPKHVSIESHPKPKKISGTQLYMPFNLYLRDKIPVIFELKQTIRTSSLFVSEKRSKVDHKVVWPNTELALFGECIPLFQIKNYRLLFDENKNNPNSWNYVDTAYKIFRVLD